MKPFEGDFGAAAFLGDAVFTGDFFGVDSVQSGR